MSEPQRNHGDVNAGLKQVNGGGVPQHMWSDALLADRGACPTGPIGVFGYQLSHSVMAERPTTPTHENRGMGIGILLSDPGTKHRDGLAGQRSAAFLAALAETPDMRT